MRVHFIAALVNIFTLLLVLALTPSSTRRAIAAQQTVELFTEDEARELRVEEDHWDPIPRARSAPLGPVIAIRSPQIKRIEGADTIETYTPTNITVVFEQNQAPVDMSSLDIKAKKGFFTKSLTETLVPFVDGTTLAVENVDVPSGKFQIQITVKDLEGHETTQTYRLIVEKIGS